MIEVQELTKRYGERVAVDRLSFSIEKGDVVGFLGPNGAGKTTTMKILTGSMAPSSGEARVAGYDVFENPIEVKSRIGYLPETPPVYQDMFVQDYLKFVAQIKGLFKNQIEKAVDEALEKANIQDVQNRLIKNLSKGYRQRVGLAQALIGDPEILILDEPTVGLDPTQVAEVRRLIQHLKGHHTIILSTHILPEVQATCENVIIINNGKIVVKDNLQGIAHKVAGQTHVKARVLRHAEKAVDKIRHLPCVSTVEYHDNEVTVGTELVDENLEQIAQEIVNTGAGLVEFSAEKMQLEDVFISLTK